MSDVGSGSGDLASTLDVFDLAASKISRSVVPEGLPYRAYRKYLRFDFFYSCAYCTIMESEAQAVRMLIDHYEPVSARPELTDSYNNLMYACEPCNLRKGDICPPAEARAAGRRFFRPDEDVRLEHFEEGGIRINSITEVGRFTIDYVDLNRLGLRRLRELRQRLMDGGGKVHEGILALRSIPFDQLPPIVRGRALRLIESVINENRELIASIDEVLRAHAKSPYVEDEPSQEEEQANKDRLKALRKSEVMYPGIWSGRKRKFKRK
jgi:hypothetical protein